MKRPRDPGKLTLKDIAREAGVSPTTVSLVLSEKPAARIGAETRRRIHAIADRLHYRPNHLARSLARNETRTIGLVMTSLLNPFYSEIAQDIIGRAKETGYGVLVVSVQGGVEDEAAAIAEVLGRGVDGLVVCSALRRDPAILDLAERRIPFVLTLRETDQGLGDPRVNSVTVDNRRGAFMAVEHLLRMGHERVAVIAGFPEVSTGHDRSEGARAAFAAYGVPLAPELFVTGDFHRNSGYRLARDLLRLEKRPTAILTANDHMAVGVLEALREERLRAPEDVALVGFDDIEMAGLPGIDLTTVSQKKATMGRMAVDIVIEKIRGESHGLVKRIILDPLLVIRNSCGFRAGGGVYRLPEAAPPVS